MSDQRPLPEYPTYPGEGAPAGSIPPPPPPSPMLPLPNRPTSVTIAVALMWLGAVVSLASIVYGLLGPESSKEVVAEAMRDTDPNVTQSEIDAAYVFGIGFTVFFGLISVGLWAWMAWKNGQGRKWARVVATVLGSVNLVMLGLTLAFAGFLMAGSGGAGIFSILLSAAEVVLAIVILVLLWQRSSNAFYDAVSERQ